jgi:hypothetical protein
MLGSQHDGEVLNAARHAERLRVRLNKSWPDLLKGGGGSDADYMMRALRAERLVAQLTQRVEALERELRGRAGSITDSPDNGGLSAEKERDLVAALSRYSHDSAWVRAFTGWPKGVVVLYTLQRIAAKHGMRVQQYGRGSYKFVPI